jgi:PAS domain S-box-containing protein
MEKSETKHAGKAQELVMHALLGDAATNVDLGLYVYDDRGMYVAVNERAAELLGYPRDELLSHHVGDFTDGGIDNSVLLRAEVREGVRIVQRKDGSRVPVAFVVAPTRVATIQFFLGVVWALDPADPRAVNAV